MLLSYLILLAGSHRKRSPGGEQCHPLNEASIENHCTVFQSGWQEPVRIAEARLVKSTVLGPSESVVVPARLRSGSCIHNEI